MAKENSVFIYGQIEGEPVIRVKETGEPVSAYFVVKCVRRPYVPGEGRVSAYNEKQIDYLPVITADPKIIRDCYDLRKNDIVQIKGAITTRWVKKALHCSNGHEFFEANMRGYITPIFISVREKGAKVLYEDENGVPVYGAGVTPDAGLEILYQNGEISNQAFLLGKVIRTPELYTFGENDDKCIASYQVSIHRRFVVYGSADSFDYPWVKTINRQARIDAQVLHEKSTIFINGAVQSRDAKRKACCSICKDEIEIKDRFVEILPYSIEYLRNCEVASLSATEADNGKEPPESKAEERYAAEKMLPAPPADYDILASVTKKEKPIPATSQGSFELHQLPAPEDSRCIIDISEEVLRKQQGKAVSSWHSSHAMKMIDDEIERQRRTSEAEEAFKKENAKKKPKKNSKKPSTQKSKTPTIIENDESKDEADESANQDVYILGGDTPSIF